MFNLFTDSLKEMFSNLTNDEIPHEPCLKKANCNQTVEPDQTSVEVPSLEIDLLKLDWNLCQTKPKSENGKDDRGQTGQYKDQVTKLEQFVGDAGLLGVGKDTAEVEKSLGDIVDD